MGFKLEIDGRPYDLAGFSAVEAATPLTGGDSSGQVGTIELTVVKRDPELSPRTKAEKYGAHMHVGKSVKLIDTRKGFTLGKVISVSDTSAATFTLSCETRLGELNVYNVQVQPFTGTLGQAFDYYCSVAGITTDVLVDPTIENRVVTFQGFNGELWYNLKLMAAAIDVEVSLVSGVILLRPIRQREAIRGRAVERGVAAGGQLAQAVEVAYYNHKPITNKLVYPPGGWSNEVPVINVNAGEYIEEVVELSASVTSIEQPVMQSLVPPEYETTSVYTVITDEGLNVPPQQWADYGGSLTVVINPDTTSLTVKIQAPTGIGSTSGTDYVQSFSIALAADSYGTYSTLRIVGTGVSFDRKTLRVATGVTPSETGFR